MLLTLVAVAVAAAAAAACPLVSSSACGTTSSHITPLAWPWAALQAQPALTQAQQGMPAAVAAVLPLLLLELLLLQQQQQLPLLCQRAELS